MYANIGRVLLLVIACAHLACARDGTARADVYERELALAQEKFDDALAALDQVRSELGLPPVNLQHLGNRSRRLQEQWRKTKEQLIDAEERQKVAESMSPEDRDIAARLYIPQVSSRPLKRDGAWLLKVIRAECAIFKAKLGALEADFDVDETMVSLDEKDRRRLSEAEHKLRIQKGVLERIKERAEKERPSNTSTVQ